MNAMTTKMFDLGRGSNAGNGGWTSAGQVWDLYCGNTVPEEWNLDGQTIDASVAEYLASETPAHWLAESGDDPEGVAGAIVWMIEQVSR